MKLSPALRQTLSDMLRGHIRRKYRTQAAAARAWGVQSVFVSRVLSGERPPTDTMMSDAGIVLVPMWREKEESNG